MKIKSNYTDYYDQEAYVYGVDPLLFYNRECDEQIITLPKYHDVCRFKTPTTEDWCFYRVSILGYTYLIGQRKREVSKGIWEVYEEKVVNKIHSQFFDEYVKAYKGVEKRTYYPFWGDKSDNPDNDEFYDQFEGDYSSSMMSIHSDLGIPVFAYSRLYRENTIEIHKHVPHLGDLGFGRLLNSFALYNQLQDFFAKRLTEKETTAIMTNEAKVESKGFDKKISFRHRK